MTSPKIPDGSVKPGTELQAFRRSVAKRFNMQRRFVRRGASYWNALVAANKLFPLAPLPEADRREARRVA